MFCAKRIDVAKSIGSGIVNRMAGLVNDTGTKKKPEMSVSEVVRKRGKTGCERVEYIN